MMWIFSTIPKAHVMYNASKACLNAQININAIMDRKVEIENSLLTSYIVFKGFIPTISYTIC